MSEIQMRIQQIPTNQMFLVHLKNGTTVYAYRKENMKVFRTAEYANLDANPISLRDCEIQLEEISDIIEV